MLDISFFRLIEQRNKFLQADDSIAIFIYCFEYLLDVVSPFFQKLRNLFKSYASTPIYIEVAKCKLQIFLSYLFLLAESSH